MNVQQYLAKLDEFSPETVEQYKTIYGDSGSLIYRRQKGHTKALLEFSYAFGEKRECVLVRCPSRINLLGMHIEHRGGYVNPIAIGSEIVLVASPRRDNRFNVRNVESDNFPDTSFALDELLPNDPQMDWVTFVNHVQIERGHWGNYVRAALLRLQMEFPDKPFCGMDIMVYGDIPRGAGVSSSSALVVSTALAAVHLNEIEVDRKHLTVLCGEGEWYVGTRGGAGDQGAMLLGKQNCITHMQFFPLHHETIPLPPGYVVLLARSFVDAHKAAGARSVFNERVATYDISLMMVRRRHPQLASRIRYLRDVSPSHLGVDEAWVYRLLQEIPETMNRDELLAVLPEESERLHTLFGTHDNPAAGYKLRQVLLYGIAECAKADHAGSLLRRGDIEEFGKLMCISHDGDRVVRYDSKGFAVPHNSEITDQALDRLIDLSSSKCCPESAHLYRQAGGYACSHPRVDQLVDILLNIPEVLGARVTGAGLGGCVVALVPKDFGQQAINALDEQYYNAHGLPEGAEVCVSVEGACLL